MISFTTFWPTVFLSVIVLALSVGDSNLIFGQTKDVSPNMAAAAFEAGQNAHQKGDFAGAIRFYEKAIDLHPEFPEAEFQRGAALQELDRLSEAEKALRRAAELRPGWALPLAQLGRVLLAANRLEEAKTYLRKTLELAPNDDSERFALIKVYLETKASISLLHELLQETRKIMNGGKQSSAELWAARATLERSLGDSAAAQTSLARALAIETDNIAARLERAEQFVQSKNYTAALEDVELALSKQPNNMSAQFLLARIYAESGKAKEALNVLEAFDAHSKDLPQITELRNMILASNIDGPSNNVSQLERILVREPQNAVVLGKLCWLTRTSNSQKALQYCQRANQLEPINISHAVGFGAALVQARRFGEAIAVLNQALKVEPSSYAARANLAIALYENKQYLQAINEFNLLLKEQPSSAATYFFLATAHDMLLNYPEALAAYRKFLALADSKQNQLEIDKTNLRLPILQRQIEKGAGKKKP